MLESCRLADASPKFLCANIYNNLILSPMRLAVWPNGKALDYDNVGIKRFQVRPVSLNSVLCSSISC